MSREPEILSVGDKPLVTGFGRPKVTRIDVCLRPSTDPAAETYYARVDSIELGEHGPPFVVGLEGGTWAYGSQVVPTDIERGEDNESRD